MSSGHRAGGAGGAGGGGDGAEATDGPADGGAGAGASGGAAAEGGWGERQAQTQIAVGTRAAAQRATSDTSQE